MELKNGYKQTEIGIIPCDWKVDIVKNIAQIKTGSKNTQDRIENGFYPFYVRSQTIERINSYSYDGEAILTAGDGVGVGKVIHYVNEKFDCHQRVYRISDFISSVNGYYFYLYFSNNFYNRMMQMTAKSSVDSVRMEMIADMQIPLPPTIKEQTAIATALSDTDTWINGLEQLLGKKRQIKQGAMQELLQPKEGWEVKKLGEIATIVRGASPRPIEDPIWFDKSSPIGWVRISDVTKSSKFLTKTIQKLSSSGVKNSRLVDSNSLIMSICATVGRPILTTFNVCIHDGFVVFRNPQIEKVYLYYYLTFIEADWSKNGQTGSQMNLNTNIINNTMVPFPKSIEEQTRIASILSDMDAELEQVEIKLNKAKQLKQGMMQELLTGRIRLVKNEGKNL